MKIFLMGAFLVYFFTSIGHASFVPLGQIHVNGGSSGTCVYKVTEVEFYWYQDPWTSLSWGNHIPADVGSTFYANASTTNFNYFASKLTNRLDDYLTLRDGARPGHLDGGYIVLESADITKLVPTTYHDLAGYTINNIALTINSLTINWKDEPGQNGIIGRVQIDYDITYTINAIPEPATLLLLGVGGMIIRKFKSKR